MQQLQMRDKGILERGKVREEFRVQSAKPDVEIERRVCSNRRRYCEQDSSANMQQKWMGKLWGTCGGECEGWTVI